MSQGDLQKNAIFELYNLVRMYTSSLPILRDKVDIPTL